MTKTEKEVIARLLGRKCGPVMACGSPVLRDVHPGRTYDVCKALEADGIGFITKLDHIAFTFTTHASQR